MTSPQEQQDIDHFFTQKKPRYYVGCNYKLIINNYQLIFYQINVWEYSKALWCFRTVSESLPFADGVRKASEMFYAGMMELEYMRDLKSLGSIPCGFESHYPYVTHIFLLFSCFVCVELPPLEMK